MTGYLCRNARVARFFVGKEMHMNYEKLSGSIRAVIDRRPGDDGAYSDLFSLCREWETEDFSAAHKVNKELLALSADQVVRGGGVKFYEQWRRCLLFEAPHDFDSFMTYIELDRKPEKRFYAPRKHYLKPMVQGFQDVLDGKLRLLTISMPKRAGKSQTGNPMPTTVPTPGVTIEPITAPSSAHSTTINSERSCDLPPCSSSPSAKPVR